MIQRGKRAELSLHMTAYCVVQLLMENQDEPDYIYKQTSCFACATNSPKPTKDIFALSQTKAVSETSRTMKVAACYFLFTVPHWIAVLLSNSIPAREDDGSQVSEMNKQMKERL